MVMVDPNMENQKLILSQPLILATFIILFLYISCHYHSKNKSRRNLPPFVPKLPLIGNLYQLKSHPHRALHTMSCKYGELMMVHLGSVPTLIVSSTKAAQDVMITHDIIFSNRPLTKKSMKLLHNFKSVVASPYGAYWKQIKSLCVLNLLNNKSIRSLRIAREQETTNFVEKIREAKSYHVNLTELFINFIDDMLCIAVFGRKYSEEKDGVNFSKLTKEILELLVGFNFGDFIPSLGWLDSISGWDSKADRVAKKMDDLLEKVIKEHEEYSDKYDEKRFKGFVDVLLDVQKDPKARFQLETSSIKALMSDMFFGGTDTTYTLLEWAMSELLRHPKIMQQVQEEIRQIYGQKMNVEEDDLEQMKWLKAVIKETLRLHPPVPLLPARESTQDAKILGYDVPAKTVVLVNAWAVHRDPAIWDEPDQFKPERFLCSDTDCRGQDLQLVSFGAGRRMCPGISFAMASSELLLAKLLLMFDWELPGGREDDLDMSEFFEMILHRSVPLLAVARPHIVGKSSQW